MTTLNNVCSKYILYCSKNKNLSSLTLKAYGIDLKQFQEFCGKNILIEKVEKNLIRRFHIYLFEQNLLTATIKRKLSCIKSMFKWLELEEVIDRNPFNKIQICIKEPKKLPKNISSNKIYKIIQTSRDNLGIPQYSEYKSKEIHSKVNNKASLNKLTTIVSIEVLLCTGLRVAELVNINIGDIDFSERKIKIMGKGSRERYVFIPDEDLCGLIMSYIDCRKVTVPETDILLLNSRGFPASTQFIRTLIRNISILAGIKEKITPHMFRHSAACELIESGVDISVVQRLLGHHSISTTQIYTHISDNLLRDRVSEANIRSRYTLK